MATPRKPNGYEDRVLLDAAIGANERMTAEVIRIAEAASMEKRFSGPVTRIACELRNQLAALNQMQLIREKSRKGEPE